MTTAAELASYASSFPSFRNKIINGNFDIWQRGTSQTNDGYGSADRWFLGHSGSTKTASQQAFALGQTDVPNNPRYYLRQIVTSVTGAANYVFYNYRIEGVRTLAGKTATLSFYAKADANKNMVTEGFQWFGSGGSPSQYTFFSSATHNLTASWQKFTTTISIPTISGKTLGTDGADFFQIIFWFDAGSDYNSRTNSLGQQSGTFDIAQVQLEEGTVATPFEHRPIGTELSLCQRYYATSIPQGYTISNFPTGADGAHMIASGTNDLFGYIPFPVEMRARPTTYIYSSVNRAAGSIRRVTDGSDFAVSGYQPGTSNNKSLVYFNGLSGVSANQQFTFHYVAISEL